MNNNSFSTITTINDDYMLFPYSSHPLLHFSPSSSINDILIHSTSNTSNTNLDYHHQFQQALSPFSQFEFVPDFAFHASFLSQNHGYNDSHTISNDHHHPSLLLPLNNTSEDQPIEPSETMTHIEDSKKISTFQDPKMNRVKKPSRPDRHSKIKTAKGTRDRRMRLSLDVAKELFGLQDMLGFDKASKTVEWLLAQAKPEIIKVANTLSNQFNHSELSSGDESQTRPALGSTETSSDLCGLAPLWIVEDTSNTINTTAEHKVDMRPMRGKRKMSQPRTPILKKFSKDARAKARERAKDRTNEKMMKRRLQVNVLEQEAYDHGDEMIKSNKHEVDLSSFVATSYEEEIKELCKNNRFGVSYDITNESYEMANKLNSSFTMLNHQQIQGAATSIEQQHQFTDLHQFLGKPRDFMYNYHNMC